MRAEKGEGVIPDIEFKPGFVRRMMGLVLDSTLLCNQLPRVVRLALAICTGVWAYFWSLS